MYIYIISFLNIYKYIYIKMKVYANPKTFILLRHEILILMTNKNEPNLKQHCHL